MDAEDVLKQLKTYKQRVLNNAESFRRQIAGSLMHKAFKKIRAELAKDPLDRE